MDLTYKFGRFWVLFLPVALLGIFFKHLHQLNAMLTSIEGVGFRKTLLTLFIAFFAVWSLLYLGSVFFARTMRWVWNGETPNSAEKIRFSAEQKLEKHLKNNNVDRRSVKEREALFKLDLRGESAA